VASDSKKDIFLFLHSFIFQDILSHFTSISIDAGESPSLLAESDILPDLA
jgi:hypothetical protein